MKKKIKKLLRKIIKDTFEGVTFTVFVLGCLMFILWIGGAFV